MAGTKREKSTVSVPVVQPGVWVPPLRQRLPARSKGVTRCYECASPVMLTDGETSRMYSCVYCGHSFPAGR